MISAVVQLITPEDAKRLLDLNVVNRPLKRGWIRELTARIRDGEWSLNGASIKINDEGFLIDGQHRLLAIEGAGIAVESMVLRGLSPEAFLTLDDGKKRKGADTLSVSGERNTTVLAALIGMLKRYHDTGSPKANGATKISNSKMTMLVDSFPGCRESTGFAVRMNKKFKYLSPSATAFTHYLFNRICPYSTIAFFNYLAYGAGLTQDSPILKLRDKLIYSASAKYKYDSAHNPHLTIKAWNLFRKGSTVKKLAVEYAKDEKFPKPI